MELGGILVVDGVQAGVTGGFNLSGHPLDVVVPVTVVPAGYVCVVWGVDVGLWFCPEILK